MQRSSRAPLLSATLSTDSCWIMSASLLHDVDLEAPCVTDDLLVERMRLEHLHEHDHGLLHLVAHDDTVADLAARTGAGSCVTHRHPPGRRRLPRLRASALARAPRTRRRELRRERLPAPRGVRRAWHAAHAPASASARPGERLPARSARDGGRARS